VSSAIYATCPIWVLSQLIILAIAADVMEESQRATVFLMGVSAALLGGMLAPSLASLLMARSLWLPLLLGFGILALGAFSFALIIPETLHLRRQVTGSPMLTADLASDRSTSRNGRKHVKPSFFTAIKTKASESLKKLHGATSVLHSLPILLLLASFVVAPFSKHALGLSIRYVSNRFHWTLRKTAFLLSLRAGINIVLLLVILPSISYLLISKLHYTSKTKDLFLARFSIIFLTIGSLLIASSPTTSLTILGLSVWTLGTGFSSLTRSLITTLVDQQHVGRLYAVIAVVETVGGLIAGPTLAALYALGLKWKGGWVGLPYFLLAGISLIGALGVWSFGCVGRREKRGDPEGEGEYRDDVDDDRILLGPDPADGDMIIDF
jgi:MFS family permease